MVKLWRRRTGGGRLGGVEGRVLAILDRTGPDSPPVRYYTGENEHHRELMEEVRGMRSAQEHIATALELLLGALVPGIALPAPPSQPPPSPQP
ncbi:hypothetical protein MTO96_033055 [Rhipicephalus appendiculatus]